MFNFRSPSFKKLGLDREKLSDPELVDLMMQEPRLIRRPVVVIDQRVHFGADIKTLANLLGA
jgi:arsenate reductase-like glutaredoxin family protein